MVLTPNPPTAPPDYKQVPKGRPVNPLQGAPMGQLGPNLAMPGSAIPLETFRPPQMENPGITNVSGQATQAEPEWTGKLPTMQSGAAPQAMAVPSPVSALDPAYSMHPIVKALGRADLTGAIPMPNMYPSAWMQSPLSKAPLTKSGLLRALGFPGLQTPTETQGNAPGIV